MRKIINIGSIILAGGRITLKKRDYKNMLVQRPLSKFSARFPSGNHQPAIKAMPHERAPRDAIAEEKYGRCL